MRPISLRARAASSGETRKRSQEPPTFPTGWNLSPSHLSLCFSEIPASQLILAAIVPATA